VDGVQSFVAIGKEVGQMSRNLLSGAALFVALLAGCVGHPVEVTEDSSLLLGTSADVEFTPIESVVIPLNQDRLARAVDGKEAEIRVVLTVTICEPKWHFLGEGPDTIFEGLGHCFFYELEGDTTYTWVLASWTALGNFRLFSEGLGENYLAWVEGNNVFFAEVSEPRDRSIAIQEDFSRKAVPGMVRVPVHELIPESTKWELKAPYNDVRVQSIEKDGAGEWVIKISGPDTDQVYTLVSQKGEWHRK